VRFGTGPKRTAAARDDGSSTISRRRARIASAGGRYRIGLTAKRCRRRSRAPREGNCSSRKATGPIAAARRGPAAWFLEVRCRAAAAQAGARRRAATCRIDVDPIRVVRRNGSVTAMPQRTHSPTGSSDANRRVGAPGVGPRAGGYLARAQAAASPLSTTSTPRSLPAAGPCAARFVDNVQRHPHARAGGGLRRRARRPGRAPSFTVFPELAYSWRKVMLPLAAAGISRRRARFCAATGGRAART